MTVGTLAALLCTAGCATAGFPKEPVPVAFTVKASKSLNPDGNGRSLPTVIRFYFLKSPTRISKATFEEIYTSGRDRDVLGDDFVRMEELTVYPGETIDRDVQVDPQVRAIGAVAIVRTPVGETWRDIKVFERPGDKKSFSYVVEGSAIKGK